MNPPVPSQRICFGETCQALEFAGEDMPERGTAEVTFNADTSITTLHIYGVSEELGELSNTDYPPTAPIASIMPDGDVIVVTGSAAWSAGTELEFELAFEGDVVRLFEVSFQ